MQFKLNDIIDMFKFNWNLNFASDYFLCEDLQFN